MRFPVSWMLAVCCAGAALAGCGSGSGPNVLGSVSGLDVLTVPISRPRLLVPGRSGVHPGRRDLLGLKTRLGCAIKPGGTAAGAQNSSQARQIFAQLYIMYIIGAEEQWLSLDRSACHDRRRRRVLRGPSRRQRGRASPCRLAAILSLHVVATAIMLSALRHSDITRAGAARARRRSGLSRGRPPRPRVPPQAGTHTLSYAGT